MQTNLTYFSGVAHRSLSECESLSKDTGLKLEVGPIPPVLISFQALAVAACASVAR